MSLIVDPLFQWISAVTGFLEIVHISVNFVRKVVFYSKLSNVQKIHDAGKVLLEYTESRVYI